MIAVRVVPAGVTSSPIPASFNASGGATVGVRGFGCWRVANRTRIRRFGAPRGGHEYERIASRLTRRGDGLRPFVQLRDFGGKSGSTSDPREWRRLTRRDDAPGHQRSAAAASQTATAPPIATNCAIRLTCMNVALDRSTSTSGLCYYSPCTLRRPTPRSISGLFTSSLSFPLDTLPQDSPERHWPTSTVAR